MAVSLPSGLSVRAPTAEDVPGLVTLMNRYAASYYDRVIFSEQSVRRQWGARGFDAASDAWVISAADGQFVGYGYLFRWHQEQDESRIGCWTFVHPEYEGRGIGRALLGLTEERGRQLIDEA